MSRFTVTQHGSPSPDRPTCAGELQEFREGTKAMKKTARNNYLKLVEWSEEDNCFVGRCPELFLGGVHRDDEAKVYKELCAVVADVLGTKKKHGDRLPEPL